MYLRISDSFTTPIHQRIGDPLGAFGATKPLTLDHLLGEAGDLGPGAAPEVLGERVGVERGTHEHDPQVRALRIMMT